MGGQYLGQIPLLAVRMKVDEAQGYTGVADFGLGPVMLWWALRVAYLEEDNVLDYYSELQDGLYSGNPGRHVKFQ